MTERRSGRARKQVDYAKIEDDNDDDFADPTPPPTKRHKKLEEKTDKRKEKASREKDSRPKSVPEKTPKQNRLPLDEKLYERNLQSALQLSIQETQSQSQSDCVVVTSDEELADTSCTQTVVHSTPLPGASVMLGVEDFQESPSVMPSAIPHLSHVPHLSVVASDDIEFLGTVTCSDSDSPISKRCAASRKRKSCTTKDKDTDEGSNYTVEESSDSNEVSDADSDFNIDEGQSKSKVKGKYKDTRESKKKLPTAKKTQMTSAIKNAATPQPTASRPSAGKAAAQVKGMPADPVLAMGHQSGTTNMPNRPACVPTLGTTHKSPVWKPPGHSDGGINNSASKTLTSPSSGLRLGLSRHARIKSLHPSLNT